MQRCRLADNCRSATVTAVRFSGCWGWTVTIRCGRHCGRVSLRPWQLCVTELLICPLRTARAISDSPTSPRRTVDLSFRRLCALTQSLLSARHTDPPRRDSQHEQAQSDEESEGRKRCQEAAYYWRRVFGCLCCCYLCRELQCRLARLSHPSCRPHPEHRHPHSPTGRLHQTRQ